MTPNTQPRKKRNSSRVNLIISFTFHSVLVVLLFYFAARQGFLGKQLQKISVQMVKEKPPEKPKPPEPRPQPPKETAPPKIAEAPKPVETPKTVAPAAPPTVAPPAAELPSFEFGGGKSVIASSDPVEIYKSTLEYAFRSKWNRPENMHDDSYVAEVSVAVNRNGDVSDPQWIKSSGNSTWDKSVRNAIAQVTNLDRSPPTNFPPRVTIRFDVEKEADSLLQ
ncbi:MAG TPA: TonB C-terminal domain-containing protein [Verrucomicrobiae bacterium]|nr:TonB C-terminal domain-containing protein [Verrucomicrobiae bacterium]